MLSTERLRLRRNEQEGPSATASRLRPDRRRWTCQAARKGFGLDVPARQGVPDARVDFGRRTQRASGKKSGSSDGTALGPAPGERNPATVTNAPPASAGGAGHGSPGFRAIWLRPGRTEQGVERTQSGQPRLPILPRDMDGADSRLSRMTSVPDGPSALAVFELDRPLGREGHRPVFGSLTGERLAAHRNRASSRRFAPESSAAAGVSHFGGRPRRGISPPGDFGHLAGWRPRWKPSGGKQGRRRGMPGTAVAL